MLNSKKTLINVLAVVVIIGVMVTAYATGAEANTFWALVPPLIAIGLALVTKEVYSSLFIGIISGLLIFTNFSFTETVDIAISGYEYQEIDEATGEISTYIEGGLITSVSGIAGILIFLVELGAIVAILNKVGGSKAFGDWAAIHVKTRVGAQLATFVLGVLIFVDDYFNCLTVGSVMRPVTDSKKISRAKLSYLIDATAAPICMIAPVSSWAAAVSDFTEGTGYSGIELFIRAIPFNFYSLLTLVFIVALAVMKFDYGPMRIHEANALLRDDLYTSGEKNEVETEVKTSNGRVFDLIIPVVILIVTCIAALLYVGGFGSDGVGITQAFADTDATVGLPWGGLIALVVIMAYVICRKLINFKEAMDSLPQGFIAMVPAILILTFATTLKDVTGLLGAREYVQVLVTGSAAELSMFLPAIIFVIACFLAFSTGTSWGTFGILIPIVTSIFAPGSSLMIVGMSACLAGAVCGDHCSPISDTTIMSSAGGQCNHLNHVSTQLPYAVSVAVISFILYVLVGVLEMAGLGNLIWITLPIGILMVICFLAVMKNIVRNQNDGEIYK